MSERLPGFVPPENVDSPWVGRFWKGLDEGKLLHQTCGGCGEAFFPPRPVCPECLSMELRWEESPARGTLHSWTRVHHAPPPFTTPYLLGLADLEGGLGRLVAPLLEVEVKALEIGMALRVLPVRQPEGPTLYCFVVH